MLFDKVTLPIAGTLKDLYPLVNQRATAPSADDCEAIERELVQELMSLTTDNIQVTLESHELLYVVIDANYAINISNILPDVKTFNLGSLIKLLKTTLSTYTYFVVMSHDRKDSVCIKEVHTETGCHAMHYRTALYPKTGDHIELRGSKT